LDSFVKINTIQGSIYQAVANAQSNVLAVAGAFQSTFSPQDDGKDMFLEVLNVFAMIVGLGSAFAWNAREQCPFVTPLSEVLLKHDTSLEGHRSLR
jgi:hypothetical protein